MITEVEHISYNIIWFCALFFISQHHQKEADGLSCRLKYCVEKTGSHDFVVDAEEFKRR